MLIRKTGEGYKASVDTVNKALSPSETLLLLQTLPVTYAPAWWHPVALSVAPLALPVTEFTGFRLGLAVRVIIRDRPSRTRCVQFTRTTPLPAFEARSSASGYGVLNRLRSTKLAKSGSLPARGPPNG